LVLGIGVGFAPAYEGSNIYKTLPVPVVNINYKDGLFFANVRNGIGSYLLRGENFKMGVSAGFAPGRYEDEDEDNLKGMGNVDASATANLLAEYNFGPILLTGKFTTAVSGDYGSTVNVDIGSRYPVTPAIIVLASVGAMWADEVHMSNRFGVTESQSAASGYKQHDAESGVRSVGFSVGATYLLTEKWNVNLTFRGDKLLGIVADSPVVKNDFIPAMFFTTNYTF
jgi:outer membrane scaffolding protein for murein synthesis (MipA/OmpV family)